MTHLKDVAAIHQGLARAGRGAGRQAGAWALRIVESRDISDGWLDLDGLGEIGVVQNARTERHLLRPFDVLVTARAGRSQVALVPTDVSRTVAGITLLVVRPRRPESGMGHYLWYFLTSAHGKPQLARRTIGTTLPMLTAKNLGDVEVPVPSPLQLDAIARLVEASEEAYESAIRTARLRREAIRDAIIQDIGSGNIGRGNVGRHAEKVR